MDFTGSYFIFLIFLCGSLFIRGISLSLAYVGCGEELEDTSLKEALEVADFAKDREDLEREDFVKRVAFRGKLYYPLDHIDPIIIAMHP